MYNAANKALAILAIAAIAIASACTGKKVDPETQAATDLYNQATAALDDGEYSITLALIDSIDSLYPAQLDVRRMALNLKPRAIEQQTIAQIQAADSALANNAEELDRLTPLIKQISSPGLLEPYYIVADAYNPSFISQTAVEPRIDSEGNFYIVAQVQGGTIGLNRVQLNTQNSSMTSQAVPANRIIKEGDSELASFRMEEVDTLGQWAFNRLADITSATIIGNTGKTRPVKLSPTQAQSFGTAWRYSKLRRDQMRMTYERERLERRLQLARDQIANTLPDTPQSTSE